MQRLLPVAFLSCLAIPASLCAKDAKDHFQQWYAERGSADAYYSRDFLRFMAADAYRLGLHLAEQGLYGQAIDSYYRALAFNLEYADAYNNLAWLQATCPNEKYRDGEKAVENASKASRLGVGRNWRYTATLAAAYAESGNFEEAKLWQARAIELAPDERSKQELRAHLELYKQGKPYRQEPMMKFRLLPLSFKAAVPRRS